MQRGSRFSEGFAVMSDHNLDELDAAYDAADRLYDDKKFDDALPILNRLVEVDYPPAYFLMASYEFYHREQADALPWLKKLELAAARDDADACFRCYHAYRMNWAMIGGFETQRIGSDYLRRAAELGHVQAQNMLAEEHRSGANDQEKSESLFLYWVQKAIAGGSEDAVYNYAKWLTDKKRLVPDDLLADLAALAKEYPNAAKLLARIKRACNPKT